MMSIYCCVCQCQVKRDSTLEKQWLDEIIEVRKGLIFLVAYKGGKDIQCIAQNAALFVDLL